MVALDEAISKEGIYWFVFCKFNQLTKIYYLAGYLRGALPSFNGSLGWVRDLTGDGDIESNPGPISIETMEQLEGATDVDNLCNQVSATLSSPPFNTVCW